MLIWTGTFLSGITALNGGLQWGAALTGWICIVYIMLGGARRLEIRQNKNYGKDPEYRNFTLFLALFDVLPVIFFCIGMLPVGSY